MGGSGFCSAAIYETAANISFAGSVARIESVHKSALSSIITLRESST
jgi:hypothetical protein